MKCGIAFCQIPVEEGNTYCTQRHGKLNEEKQKAAKVYQIPKVSEKRKKELKGKSTISKGKKTGVNDSKLWKAFSLYIRLRDSDKEGIGKCFTCGRRAHFRKMDCGHGIGRQHFGTKYNERNNHIQCKPCNGFEGGMREIYKQKMNELYGPNTWELMELASKKVSKISQFEIDQLTIYYLKEVEKLTKEKGINLKKIA